MTAEKSLAIVLRVVEFSESSYVVTLFTDGWGRVSALAKGARRPRSPFEAALDLLAISRVVFLRKPGDSLDLLTEATLERRFRAASRSLPRFFAGLYVAELLGHWTEHRDADPALFALSSRTIQQLDEDGPVAPTLLHFEMHGLQLLGLLPSLDRCVECGTEVEPGPAAFCIPSGGVLCPRCKPGKKHIIVLSGGGRWLMQQLANKESDVMAISPQVPPANSIGNQAVPQGRLAWGEVRAVTNQIITYQLERKPRLQTYLARYCTNINRKVENDVAEP